jgi:hypothetical protein
MILARPGNLEAGMAPRQRAAGRRWTGARSCRVLIIVSAIAVASHGIAMAQVVSRQQQPEPQRRAPTIEIGLNYLLKSDEE